MTIWAHTSIHRPGCPCEPCRTSEFSAPADELSDDEFAAALRAAPGTRYVNSSSNGTNTRFPRAHIEVTGTWGDGVDRVATVVWNQARPKTRRSVSIGDCRSIIDTVYDTPPGLPPRVRNIIAGRFRLVERSCAEGNDIAVTLAELNSLAKGLVDPSVVVEAETTADYGYGGELVDSASSRMYVTGWERRP